MDKLCCKDGGGEIYMHMMVGWKKFKWLSEIAVWILFFFLNLNLRFEIIKISFCQRLPLARKSFWDSILKTVFKTRDFYRMMLAVCMNVRGKSLEAHPARD